MLTKINCQHTRRITSTIAILGEVEAFELNCQHIGQLVKAYLLLSAHFVLAAIAFVLVALTQLLGGSKVLQGFLDLRTCRKVSLAWLGLSKPACVC